MSDKFKQLAIALANKLGGATQITGPYKYGNLKPSYVSSPHNIVARWLRRGYVVSQGERKPGEDVNPGFAVIKGVRRTIRGTETIVAEEGLATFYYARGARQWRFTKGLILKHAATVRDLDTLLPS